MKRDVGQYLYAIMQLDLLASFVTYFWFYQRDDYCTQHQQRCYIISLILNIKIEYTSMQ